MLWYLFCSVLFCSVCVYMFMRPSKNHMILGERTRMGAVSCVHTSNTSFFQLKMMKRRLYPGFPHRKECEQLHGHRWGLSPRRFAAPTLILICAYKRRPFGLGPSNSSSQIFFAKLAFLNHPGCRDKKHAFWWQKTCFLVQPLINQNHWSILNRPPRQPYFFYEMDVTTAWGYFKSGKIWWKTMEHGWKTILRAICFGFWAVETGRAAPLPASVTRLTGPASSRLVPEDAVTLTCRFFKVTHCHCRRGAALGKCLMHMLQGTADLVCCSRPAWVVTKGSPVATVILPIHRTRDPPHAGCGNIRAIASSSVPLGKSLVVALYLGAFKLISSGKKMFRNKAEKTRLKPLQSTV